MQWILYKSKYRISEDKATNEYSQEEFFINEWKENVNCI